MDLLVVYKEVMATNVWMNISHVNNITQSKQQLGLIVTSWKGNVTKCFMKAAVMCFSRKIMIKQWVDKKREEVIYKDEVPPPPEHQKEPDYSCTRVVKYYHSGIMHIWTRPGEIDFTYCLKRLYPAISIRWREGLSLLWLELLGIVDGEC